MRSQTVFLNRTNVPNAPIQTQLSFDCPTLTGSGKLLGKRRSEATATQVALSAKKRRVGFTQDHSCELENVPHPESDVETENVPIIRSQASTPFHLIMRAITSRPGGRRERLYTQPILQSFVSSHKSDVFRCESNDMNSYLTPPYACSYSKGAKTGTGPPILAVATEQGTVHIMNTSKKSDWNLEQPRTILQVHDNGIFDVKWNTDDTLLATSSGDRSTKICCPTTQKVTRILRGHASTVKCIAWDPCHNELLSTGARDGSICVWDLRVPSTRNEDDTLTLNPVISIPRACDDPPVKRGSRGKLVSRSVTNLIYPERTPQELISSGSFDGILRLWDLRVLTSRAKLTKSAKSAKERSPVDPTVLQGSSRPRGIVSLAQGTGPTAELIFALGADSRIHAYNVRSLDPLPDMGYGHENMRANSFYVGMSLSPCGRWLATGGGVTVSNPKGSVFLYDVSFTGCVKYRRANVGVQLQSQQSEVGGIDWAENMLASCADDGTVRIWRPDIATYRDCVKHPDESRWYWSWALDC